MEDRQYLTLIIGMPGSGKTVQGQLLEERNGFRWLSTGHILREMNDPKMNKILESGALISDDWACEIVERQLGPEDHSRILLDGFPRSGPQAEWFVDYIKLSQRFWVDNIISLELDESIARERLSSRNRGDDNDQVIDRRIEEFKKLSDVMHIVNRELKVAIHTIDASSDIESIHQQIVKVVESK